MCQIAQFLKTRHIVAHSGRADLQVIVFAQRLGTHRRGLSGVFPDNQFQYQFLAISQFFCWHVDTFFLALSQ